MKNNLLLAFYGDDFTGSTDAMEVLAGKGWRTLLFMDPPDPADLAKYYPDVDCIGIAGVSRSLPTDQLESELFPVFEAMQSYHPAVMHYKVCSTFDSSSNLGSIGKVMEIAAQLFPEQNAIPILIGAPQLKRYTLFGHHFAAMGDVIHRLDRHPVMSFHPSTPMDEADLRLHLSKQTDMKIDLMTIVELQGNVQEVKERFLQKWNSDAAAILMDSLQTDDALASGRIFADLCKSSPTLFVVGSSGVEYALCSVWEHLGKDERHGKTAYSNVGSSGPLLVLSGSASAVTQQQIEAAESHGFISIRLPLEELFTIETEERSFREVMNKVVELLDMNKSVILYTAKGPADANIAALKKYFSSIGLASHRSSEKIGRMLGKLAKKIIEKKSVRRLVIAGGDTSSYATRELGVTALEMIAPIAPGAPLNVCYSDDTSIRGLELALKGGQLGQSDYFIRVQNGFI